MSRINIREARRHPEAPDLERAELLADALRGLAWTRKSLPCKWLYDEEGARLFGEITKLPEYYPTRTEMGILRDRAAEIGAAAGSGAALVEFGSGDGEKAAILLGAMPVPAAYVPVDIAPDWLEQACRKVAAVQPGLSILPVVADFSRPFAIPEQIGTARRIGFFPGSTIGNFTAMEAAAFLRRARRTLGDGALFVLGADLVKDVGVLLRAYDDAAGVTARFNLNLLCRLNRVCGADFDPAAFGHRAVWNAAAGRVEMHLVAQSDQDVILGGQHFRFVEGESIHTESSHKYRPEQLRTLCTATGWDVLENWTDQASLFSVWLLRASTDANFA